MSNSIGPGTRPLTAFDQLRSWILRGALAPGQRLPVRDVARGLGLSTMPVREALVRLEEAGLVTQERHKGAVVSRLSLENLNDFYNLRRIIEPPSIQMGIERMTPKRLNRLQATMDNLRRAVEGNDLTTVLDLDEDLLSLIHAAVSNKELARVIHSTWTRVRPYKLLFTTTAQNDAGHYIADEDLRLVEAAETGDSTGARDLMEQSLINAQVRLSDLLRDHAADEDEDSIGSSLASGESLATVIAALVEEQSATEI